MSVQTLVSWIRFRPGRIGGPVSVGLASCDCKSIPLLCNGCICLCVYVWGRKGSGDKGVSKFLRSRSNLTMFVFPALCFIRDRLLLISPVL